MTSDNGTSFKFCCGVYTAHNTNASTTSMPQKTVLRMNLLGCFGFKMRHSSFKCLPVKGTRHYLSLPRRASALQSPHGGVRATATPNQSEKFCVILRPSQITSRV